MNKIGIVILNYLNWKDTIECVESLKTQTSDSYEIVVVDNGSNNESYLKLVEKYKGESNINIINTGKNLGYARGNNVGINYLIEKFEIYNILVVNNDTIFSDNSMIEYLSVINFDKNIGAIGPKIIGNDNKNQNPVKIKNNRIQILKSILLTTIQLAGLEKLIRKNQKQYQTMNSEELEHKSKNFILHGSAIFLTQNYLKLAHGFYPETFLYFEENILDLIMKKFNLTMIYDDQIHIYHKEDQSSALSFGNDKRIFNKYAFQSELIALKLSFYSPKKIINKINKFVY